MTAWRNSADVRAIGRIGKGNTKEGNKRLSTDLVRGAAVEAADVLAEAIDVDSHEMAPAHKWGSLFGSFSGELAERISPSLAKIVSENCLVRPGLEDVADISQATVWEMKGPDAPGAFDFTRRLSVLDTMGVRRQLVFPTAALQAFFILSSGGNDGLREFMGLDWSSKTDELLVGSLREYNDWALEVTAKHSDRMRPATPIAARSLETLLVEARDLVSRGARAIWIPTSPPGGLSPANPGLDPFWELMESSDVSVNLHLGTEANYRGSGAWLKAPVFTLERMDSLELSLEPFTMATVHHAPEAFLTCMVFGGVFERFPRLRFGVIETGAAWFGPLATQLDTWASQVFRKRVAGYIQATPSEYLARNVRVTPFFFEPFDEYFRAYPNLADSFCYSTDYPHKEGGVRIKERSLKLLAPLGEEVVTKYFVENGKWLVPD